MIDTIMTWVISVGGILLTLGVTWMLGVHRGPLMTTPQFANYACPEHVEELILELLDLLPEVRVTKVSHDEYQCDGELRDFYAVSVRHCRRTAVVVVGSAQ
jgi:hypothetical protein